MKTVIGSLLLLLMAGQAAHAEVATLVFTMESGDPSVRPDEVRRSLAERLGWEVLDLASAQGHEPHVVVALGLEGPAAVVVRVEGHEPQLFQIARGQEPGWIVAGLVPALEARAVLRPAALRSWSGQRAPGARRSVLRPWPGSPSTRPMRRRYRIEREWIEAGTEVGAALSAPPPGGRVSVVRRGRPFP